MSRPLIVATAVFLLIPSQVNTADAAGPYDGEWAGTATSTGERCKQAVVKFVVEGVRVRPSKVRARRAQHQGNR